MVWTRTSLISEVDSCFSGSGTLFCEVPGQAQQYPSGVTVYQDDCSGHLVANNGVAMMDATGNPLSPHLAPLPSPYPQSAAVPMGAPMPKVDNTNQSMINNLNRMSTQSSANRHPMINPTVHGMNFDTPIENLDMSFPLPPMVSNYPINNPVLNSAILEKLKQLPECKFFPCPVLPRFELFHCEQVYKRVSRSFKF